MQMLMPHPRRIGHRVCALAALLVSAGMTLAASPAVAASFDLLSSEKFDAWEANFFRNISSGRTFCAAQTTSGDGSVLRVNLYNDNREAFLELYNPAWSLREGGVRFALSFDGGYTADLQGKSWGDSYTHDFLVQENMLVLLGLLVKHNQVRLVNSNGMQVSEFSLKGSSQALAAFDKCAGGI
ncbi:MAG TPA: hypothetical protein VGN97_02820 [Mesorhizobium sp.]|nr:hypothetical protein [Mesorhizobium sp.]